MYLPVLPESPNTHFHPACGIAQTTNGPEFVVIGMYENVHIDIFNIDQNKWRVGTIDWPGSKYFAGYIQWEESFLVVADDTLIWQYTPADEKFILKEEKTTHHATNLFLLLIDGTQLNCV
jgi:hypothetical protein